MWAEPSGLLDSELDYLFCEATVLDVFQTAEGWAVSGGSIDAWFAESLPLLGLSDGEVQDFVDYWSGGLPDAPCFGVFPQYEEQIIETMGLAIEPAPDSLLRLWLYIEAREECDGLAAPETLPFERQGFTAVEWGVVPHW